VTGPAQLPFEQAHSLQPATERRHIGALGTIARLALGGYLVGSVIYGHIVRGFHLLPWVEGLIIFPAVILLWHWLRIRRNPNEFKNISIPAVIFNFGLFWLFYLITATSDMALIFYGTSILLAGVRGYSGCEILAISNVVLRRDDQIGCAVFTPLDLLEQRVLKVRRVRLPWSDHAASARWPRYLTWWTRWCSGRRWKSQ